MSSPSITRTVSMTQTVPAPPFLAVLRVLTLALWIAGSMVTGRLEATPTPNLPSVTPTSDAETSGVGLELFEQGLYEEAAAVYAANLDPERPNATVIYNLATALHHQGELPQAILWYLRGDGEDPWLQENLFLARRSLGSQRLQLDGLYGVLHRHGKWLGFALIAWIWLSGLPALLLPKAGARIAIVAALAGTLTYLSLAGLQLNSPQQVVLLQDCEIGAAKLPAGTEAWARPVTEGWKIHGDSEAICPTGTLEPVNL